MGLFGHLGLGLITKRFTHEIPLWSLLLSTMLIDLPAIFLSNLIPLWLTHGLIMAAIWSILTSICTINIIKKSNSKLPVMSTSIILGLLVFSHWVIDLFGWSMMNIGIPLFFNDVQLLILPIQMNLIIGALIIEISPFILGLIIFLQYYRNLKKNDPK